MAGHLIMLRQLLGSKTFNKKQQHFRKLDISEKNNEIDKKKNKKKHNSSENTTRFLKNTISNNVTFRKDI